MKFIKTDITPIIDSLRAKLYQKLIAPIDAMWELLYIASSQHFLITNDDETLGYCCINEEKSLIQIFIEEEYSSKIEIIIKELISSKLIGSASLSSNETLAFNASLLQSKSIKANTFCYEHLNKPIKINSKLILEEAKIDDIPAIKAFLNAQVGMDDTFGYTENLVSRKEIFLLRNVNEIIATSECRISDSQSEIADLGIIVNIDYQGKGIATEVMQIQVNRVLQAGRKPICSTTLDNIASRKAIEKAGFYCSNIIFDISF